MKERPTEKKLATVPIGARRAREIQDRWCWVEPSVWTDRMLTALEDGVKGGRWYSLMDKVHSIANLRSAFARVKANRGSAGVDHVTIRRFEANLEVELEKLSEELQAGSYRPQPIRRV